MGSKKDARRRQRDIELKKHTNEHKWIFSHESTSAGWVVTDIWDKSKLFNFHKPGS